MVTCNPLLYLIRKFFASINKGLTLNIFRCDLKVMKACLSLRQTTYINIYRRIGSYLLFAMLNHCDVSECDQ